MSSARSIFSTGILRKAAKTRFALVDIVNLSASTARSVTVQVFDWSSGLPVALKVSPCNTIECTVSVGPKMSAFLFADVSKVAFKYEVRVKQPQDSKLITNVTGVSNKTFNPQTGNSVLQLQLVRIG